MEKANRFSMLGRRGKPRTLEEKFWDYVELIPFHTCWEWSGSHDEHGYSRIAPVRSKKLNSCRRKSPMKASRVSWELHYGPIPKRLCVLHKCDNPGCVNPSHLFVGTQLDNIKDMIRKGRHRKVKGRKYANGKVVCKYGHEKELLPNQDNRYVCRVCMNSWSRRNPERARLHQRRFKEKNISS